MSYSPPPFLQSDHVSSRTRSILLRRMEQEQGRRENLSPEAFQLLETVCDDILPQQFLLGDLRLNLAVMIDQSLAGSGDGWRFAELPADLQAWEDGLTSLNQYAQALFSQNYTALHADQRGVVLDQAFDGTLPEHDQAVFSPEQMALWSGDLRHNIVSFFLAHPVVQDRLGISANMTGGDHIIQGFKADSLTDKEGFEPDHKRHFMAQS
ncbi:gluconate 2-dehydrogenase subunit 3 family protein [Bombella sp. TMW 2.2559]|uniref:Gluconate 2-dehydrogenase subunit 3 family protein n=1 Tax=Bombella dulcis TaxID=2967339 RepID=A0ABT3WFL7_9PROT|nr:gluconate 2-dehydrogenase subunit 3 family protein [Bombella dulcis]MCX5616423.1 gluconate 2-dehydrogenase subunit 3 family protein [Bombella dulcis]